MAEVAEPGEQMRIAAQLRELEQLREIRLQKRKEATDGATMALGGSRSHGGRETLERGFKNLLEDVRGRWGGSMLFGPRWRRDIGGNDKAGRHGMAIRVCIVEQAPQLE